jgi:hypothetical protein
LRRAIPRFPKHLDHGMHGAVAGNLGNLHVEAAVRVLRGQDSLRCSRSLAAAARDLPRRCPGSGKPRQRTPRPRTPDAPRAARTGPMSVTPASPPRGDLATRRLRRPSEPRQAHRAPRRTRPPEPWAVKRRRRAQAPFRWQALPDGELAVAILAATPFATRSYSGNFQNYPLRRDIVVRPRCNRTG